MTSWSEYWKRARVPELGAMVGWSDIVGRGRRERGPSRAGRTRAAS